MLSKRHRLRSKDEVGGVIKRGKGVFVGSIRIVCRKNTFSTTRFAFLVGKKSVPTAAGRNRMRRYMREGVRQALPNIVQGYDVVCLFSAKGTYTKEEIQKSLTCALKKAHICEK